MLLSRLLDVRGHAGAWLELSGMVRQRRALLMAMTWRDLTDRYAGQVLGTLWVVLMPLLTMATYLLAFGIVFRGRLGPADDGWGYVAYMLAGLAPWIALQDGLARATTAVTGQAGLVKQVVFPSEVLPMRVALASLPALLVGVAITVAVAVAAGQWQPLGLAVMLPVAVLCFLLLQIGLAFILSALGVFLRDLKDVVAFLLGIGLFLHPVLYPPASVPGWLAPWFAASPLSHVVWCFRDALTVPDPARAWSWIVLPLVSVAACTAGWRFYRMLKPTFGNAL
jgi:lipopolysaccharide transport system permease protein